jgi:hypothetical protein
MACGVLVKHTVNQLKNHHKGVLTNLTHSSKASQGLEKRGPTYPGI